MVGVIGIKLAERELMAPLDEDVGRRLRFVTKPVILVANKSDTLELEPQATDFYKLGRGRAVCVSAEQKRGRRSLIRGGIARLAVGRLDEQGHRGAPDGGFAPAAEAVATIGPAAPMEERPALPDGIAAAVRKRP